MCSCGRCGNELWLMGDKSCNFSAVQGKKLASLWLLYFTVEPVRQCSLEGRQFAMMAAQGLDVLWISPSFSLILLVVTASANSNGTLANGLSYSFVTQVSVSDVWWSYSVRFGRVNVRLKCGCSSIASTVSPYRCYSSL